MHKNMQIIRFAVMLSMITLPLTAPRMSTGQTIDRRVALTFDDLPVTRVDGACDPVVARQVNAKLLAGLARADARATGLVNAGTTCGVAPERLRDRILEHWLDAGHELGNHTWSHPDLEWTGLEAYLEDARKGGEVLEELLAERGERLVWFRHPMLHAGDTSEKKGGLSRFLDARGWRVAPVTVDNQEWVYAYVYHVALERGDSTLARRIASAYLDHLDSAFEYFEARSREVVGREIPQVLLLHANRLNADRIGEVLARIGGRGYRIVALADVMADPAYRRGDPYLGSGGPSWIERWAVAEGGEVRRGPREAAWVAAEFRRLRDERRTGGER